MAKESAKTQSKVIPLREEAPVRRRTRPGYLIGTVNLKLHTLEANNLVFGRVETARNKNIVGVLSFARAYRQIQQNAHKKRISRVIDDTEESFRHLQNQIEEHKRQQLVQIENYGSVKPRDVKLRSMSETGARAASLLVKYDRIVLDIRQLHVSGVYDQEQRNQMLRKALDYIRSMLESPFFTRDDVQALTSPSNFNQNPAIDDSNNSERQSEDS